MYNLITTVICKWVYLFYKFIMLLATSPHTSYYSYLLANSTLFISKQSLCYFRSRKVEISRVKFSNIFLISFPDEGPVTEAATLANNGAFKDREWS